MRTLMKKWLMTMAFVPLMALSDTETVDGIEWTYSIADGTVQVGAIDPEGTRTWRYPAISPSTVGPITIPSTLGGCPVTSIGSFYGCSGITAVSIPPSVTNIGSYAFCYCSNLVSVAIPPVQKIREWTFMQCTGLTSVQISPGVTSIGVGAFFQCAGLVSVTIPSSVKYVNGRAFEACRGLKSVTMQEGVTSIGDRAFWNCGALTSVTVPSTVTCIQFDAFSGTPFLKNQPDGLIILGAVLYATKGLTLSAVTIPDGVAYIGSRAFSGCSGLTSLTIPTSVTSIRPYAFSGCSGLTSLTLPPDVTVIADSTFSGCSGLRSVTIPAGVTDIGPSAFSGCSGLMSLTIPPSVTDIWERAFCSCSKLASLTFDGNAPHVDDRAFEGVSSDCTALVRKGTSGWNVDIPGLWQGIKIDYAQGAGRYVLRFCDGSSVMAEMDCERDRIYALPKNVHALSFDKRFAGWACSNGRRYDDGVLVFDLAQPGETVTMTAIWE